MGLCTIDWQFLSFRLITFCYNNLNNRQPSILLFLDIKKAFDLVSHKKLLKKLNFYGIRSVANSLMMY